MGSTGLCWRAIRSVGWVRWGAYATDRVAAENGFAAVRITV